MIDPSRMPPLTTGRKGLVLALLWIAFFTAYLDRTSISIAAPQIVGEFGARAEDLGYVFAAFTAGYALMQIPGGLLADFFGVKRMLVISLAAWSLFTGLTALATTLGVLIAVRFFFGVGEGLENGAHFKGLGDTFPTRERSAASGVLHTSIALGPAIVAPVGTLVMNVVGWHAFFFALMVPGLLVALSIALVYPRTAFVPAERPATGDAVPLEVGRGAAAFVAYLLFNIAFWGFLNWMPLYLSSVRHIRLDRLGFVAAVPYLFGLAGLLAFGFLARGPLVRWRPVIVAVGYLGAAAGLAGAFLAPGVLGSVAGLSCAAFFLYGTFGPFWAVVLEGLPVKFRGSLSATINFGGQIGGFIAPLVVGKIVSRTGSYAGAFAFMGLSVVVAAFVVLLTIRPDPAPFGRTELRARS